MNKHLAQNNSNAQTRLDILPDRQAGRQHKQLLSPFAVAVLAHLQLSHFRGRLCPGGEWLWGMGVGEV